MEQDRKIILWIAIIPAVFIFINCSSSKKTSIVTMDDPKNELAQVLREYHQYFDSVVQRKDDLKVQIIYTQINRKKNGKASFTDFYFNVNDNSYFYPAS